MNTETKLNIEQVFNPNNYHYERIQTDRHRISVSKSATNPDVVVVSVGEINGGLNHVILFNEDIKAINELLNKFSQQNDI